MLLLLVVVAILILVPLGYGIFLYNQLVSLRNRYRNAFSEIDVQLRRRHDLIPNLVATAKGYMQHERGTLDAVTTARAAAVTALTPGGVAIQKISGAENALSGALGQLLARAEAYPDLKANQTMSQLMEELRTTENRIAFARQAYNDAVMFYNTAVTVAPTNLIAGYFHFGAVEFFKVENAEDKQLPQVSFP